MGPFSENQLILIQKLRQNVAVELQDDYARSDENLSNWLHHKNWKVEKAEKAIRKNIKWRKDNRIDGILGEQFGSFYENLKYYTDAVDKQGRIVLTSWTNQVDTEEALNHYVSDKDKGDRHQIYRVEMLFDLVKKAHAATKGKVTSCVVILDCNELKLKPFMSKLVELVPRVGAHAKQIEKNYPGLMETTYIINAPSKLSMLYLMIKPFLKSDTKKKIQIFGRKDGNKWRDAILQIVAPDQLRQRFGGTRPNDL